MTRLGCLEFFNVRLCHVHQLFQGRKLKLAIFIEYTLVLDLNPLQRILRLRGHVFHTKIKRSAYSNYVDLIAGGSRTYAHIYPDSRDIQGNMPEHITILPLLSYEGKEESLGPRLDCLVLEPILVTTAKSYRRIAFLKADQGQDLAFFGRTILKDGSGKMGEGVLSDINLM